MSRFSPALQDLQKHCIFLLLVGFILFPSLVIQAAPSRTQVIVLPGTMTWRNLAEKYLGSADKWKELPRLNRRLPRRWRSNPDFPLPAGTRIVLPAEAAAPPPPPGPRPPAAAAPAPPGSPPPQAGPVDTAAGLKGKTRVGILPFEVPRNQPDIEQYGTGTMDSLITGLKRVPQFLLIDRSRIERILKEQTLAQTGLVDAATAVKVGKLLGAQALITGSIQTAGTQIRIVANFIDVKTGEVSDSQMVTGRLESIFDLQDHLAVLFIKNQNVAVTEEQLQRVDKVLKSTSNLMAYDFFLKGRKAYLQFSPEAWSEAVQWYQKAIAVDPRYALAYAGLAETLGTWWMLFERKNMDLAEKAYAASQKALELNADLPEAHRSFGMVAGILGKSNPEEAFHRALELNPYDAETWFYLWVGTNQDPEHEYIRKVLQLNPDLTFARAARAAALNRLQRNEEAIAEYREAIRLSPTNPGFHLYVGTILMELKRYDEAIPEFQAVLRLTPQMVEARLSLALIYETQGRWAEAISEYEEILRLDPNHPRARENLPKARERMKALP